MSSSARIHQLFNELYVALLREGHTTGNNDYTDVAATVDGAHHDFTNLKLAEPSPSTGWASIH